MANYANLKSAIQAVIKENGNQEITGNVLQAILLTMINSLGGGYQFVGIANPNTVPGLPDQKVFYLAGPGVYNNFIPTVIDGNQIGIFKYDSAWSVETLNLAEVLDKLKLGEIGYDFAISDDIGFTIVAFQNGHIRTKNFDSSLVPTPEQIEAGHPVKVEDFQHADLVISDENGLCIVGFEKGHIKTKGFDSLQVNQGMLKGKKVAFIGDSITAGSNAEPSSKRYSSIFCSLAGCLEVNLGVAGTCIADNTRNGQSSQRFITRATQQNIGDADLIVVWGGTNDFSYDSKAIGSYFVEQTISGGTYTGTKKRVAPSDTDTFAGALHELILQIQSVAPNAQIVFIQPLNRGHYQTGRPNSYEINTYGNYLQDFRDAINAICAFYSVPVVPMDVLLNQNWANDGSGSFKSYDSDGIHPNNLGHEAIAKLLFKWVVNNIVFV